MSTCQQNLVDLESLFVTADGAGVSLTAEQCREVAMTVAEIRLHYVGVLNLLAAEVNRSRLMMLDLAGQQSPGVIAIFPERRRHIEIEGEVLSVPLAIEGLATGPTGGAA